MIFNIIYGKAAFATINASTQYSSSFTCSDGTITLSASGTSVSFVVPKSGTWTVTCTYGGTTKSNTVSVTTYGGTYSTSFTFIKYLYHNGVQDVAWSDILADSDSMRLKAYTRTTNMVDLTNYSTLTVKYKVTFGDALNSTQLGYRSSSTSTDNLEKQVRLTYSSSEITKSLDISAVNASKYVAFISQDAGNATATIRVYQVYLTP